MDTTTNTADAIELAIKTYYAGLAQLHRMVASGRDTADLQAGLESLRMTLKRCGEHV